MSNEVVIVGSECCTLPGEYRARQLWYFVSDYVRYLELCGAAAIGETDLSTLWRGGAYTALRESNVSGRRQDLTPCKGWVLV